MRWQLAASQYLCLSPRAFSPSTPICVRHVTLWTWAWSLWLMSAPSPPPAPPSRRRASLRRCAGRRRLHGCPTARVSCWFSTGCVIRAMWARWCVGPPALVATLCSVSARAPMCGRPRHCAQPWVRPSECRSSSQLASGLRRDASSSAWGCGCTQQMEGRMRVRTTTSNGLRPPPSPSAARDTASPLLSVQTWRRGRCSRSPSRWPRGSSRSMRPWPVPSYSLRRPANGRWPRYDEAYTCADCVNRQ
mmetsp:Transcript_19582/g.50578  ORF Transcript_19582/g.50578 Transcript_19582/m.50578 type:complete len:247 (-) Transcript_19582:70-810(-)